MDPDRIGAMGFSAGGSLAVLSSTAFATRTYAAFDEADQASLRQGFAIPVYPRPMTQWLLEAPAARRAGRNPDLRARAGLPMGAAQADGTPEHDAARGRGEAAEHGHRGSRAIPPTLLVHARDDPIDPVHYAEVYGRAMKAAGVDVTLRL